MTGVSDFVQSRNHDGRLHAFVWRIIFGIISHVWMWGYGLDRADSGQGQVAGTYECSNKPSGSIKCGEFFD